jgi:receptor protein-tyrosine kinase
LSLIEEAAKRLEELRKSGVDVPDALVEEQPEEAERPVAPRPSRIPPSRAVNERASASAESSARPAPTKAGEGNATSRAVHIDLERLAAAGFVTPDAPRTKLASEFRMIKRPLLANAQGTAAGRSHNANVIMVTSAVAGEGKSFTALNLAMSMAMELDNTVLLVDADVAHPVILDLLGVPSDKSKGLMNMLTDQNLDLSSLILRTNIEKLSVLPAGTPHPRATEFLASDAMTRLVDEMAVRYPDRVIIFDSPPLLLTTESPVLATHMGQIVVVVEAERTTEATFMLALSKIEQCPIVMSLLNKASASNIGSYYGYGYGYGLEQGPSKDRE